MVKRAGVSGSVKALDLGVLARRWRVPSESIQALVDAAIADGAIMVEDGVWTLANWDVYQKPDLTAASRQRRYRADKSRLSPLRRDTVTDRNVTVGDGVTRHATETLTVTETKKRTTKAAARVDYTDDFNSLWKIHPRGPKSDAFREYLKAVPSRLSHDDLKACYQRYVLSEITDRFKGWDTFRWIRDGRWEEYLTTNGNGTHKSAANPMGLRRLNGRVP